MRARERHVACAAAAAAAVAVLGGCRHTFEAIRTDTMIHSGPVIVLEGEDGDVLVAPGLGGRVLTSRVGSVESVGFVSLDAIEAGELPGAPFNNFGGQDRFWIGPESGQLGFYFPAGSGADRAVWRVPPPLNTGAMTVSTDADADEHGAARREKRGSVVLERAMTLTNASGTSFDLSVRREISVIPAADLNEEIGTTLPDGVSYVGCASLNTIVNAGDEAWSLERGVPCIWILGQFNAGPRVTVIAPLRSPRAGGKGVGKGNGNENRSGDGSGDGSGDAAPGAPVYDDSYFGPVPPDRLRVVDGAVLFRADARREGKFGLDPRHATGLAGSYDPEKDLLVIVKFDVDRDGTYASFHWGERLAEPYGGDVLQVYNSGGGPGAEFYELESVSPCRELAPGQRTVHRHATFAFVGPRARLDTIATRVLGVGLDDVVAAMAVAPEAGNAPAPAAP